MTETGSRWRRRALLAAGAAAIAGWTIGLPRLLVCNRSALTFREIPGLAPFRMLEAAGSVSTAGAILTGLDGRQGLDAADADMVAQVRADPCAALFGVGDDPRLPVAFFSDFNCPNCRVLDAALLDYDARNPATLRIVRHELPLLGEASIIASKAVLAADLQGGAEAIRARLVRARLVTDQNYVLAIAKSVGLDGPRLVADMASPQIQAKLDKSRAIAKLFGFYGTPSTVIGKSAFIGAIPAADVAQIIQTELGEPKPACRTG